MKVLLTLLLPLVLAAGCNSDATPVLTTTETFASRMQEGGYAWRTLNVPTAGDVTLQLISVTQANAILNLGVGRVSGGNCVNDESVDTAANADAVAPQITRTLAVGDYCVQLRDTGHLTQTIDFSISIQKPF